MKNLREYIIESDLSEFKSAVKDIRAELKKYSNGITINEIENLLNNYGFYIGDKILSIADNGKCYIDSNTDEYDVDYGLMFWIKETEEQLKKLLFDKYKDELQEEYEDYSEIDIEDEIGYNSNADKILSEIKFHIKKVEIAQ